eukprot:COSAG05_NODE_292_length_12012_cov_12.968354_20_plen_171_part_00
MLLEGLPCPHQLGDAHRLSHRHEMKQFFDAGRQIIRLHCTSTEDDKLMIRPTAARAALRNSQVRFIHVFIRLHGNSIIDNFLNSLIHAMRAAMAITKLQFILSPRALFLTRQPSVPASRHFRSSLPVMIFWIIYKNYRFMQCAPNSTYFFQSRSQVRMPCSSSSDLTAVL